MPGRNYLHIPGPTIVPQRIRNAMAIEQEDMRAADFPEFTLPLFNDLKKIFKTETGRIFIFPSSGTGGWEAAITNTLSPGDKVLMSHFGQFSQLWVDMCRRHGLDVHAIEMDWGDGVPVDRYAEILKADTNKEIKAVFATQNETATGVKSDVPGVRKALDESDHGPCVRRCGSSWAAWISRRTMGVDLRSAVAKRFYAPKRTRYVGSVKNPAARTDHLVPQFFPLTTCWGQRQGYFPHTPTLLSPSRALAGSTAMLNPAGLDYVFRRHHAWCRRAQAVTRHGAVLLQQTNNCYSYAQRGTRAEGFAATQWPPKRILPHSTRSDAPRPAPSLWMVRKCGSRLTPCHETHGDRH